MNFVKNRCIIWVGVGPYLLLITRLFIGIQPIFVGVEYFEIPQNSSPVGDWWLRRCSASNKILDTLLEGLKSSGGVWEPKG